MSGLRVFSASTLGVQLQPHQTALATRNAYETVAEMGGGGQQASILAVGSGAGAGAGAGAIVTTDTVSAEPQYLIELRDTANNACFVDKNPQQCSYYSQLYASADAARHFTGGEADRFREDAKREGSLWKWFYAPTWTGPVRGTTRDVSSVAVVMSQTPSQAPVI